jgi:hypothetical protein
LNEPPIDDQLAHFFPLPPHNVLDDWKKGKASDHVDLTDLSKGDWKGRLPKSLIKGKDLAVFTLEQMVGPQAGFENTNQSMASYVTGTTGSGDYIRLDIHKSRQKAPHVHISADIDCILWITDRLKVTGSVDLQILPYTHKVAPINKNNHAYVELYWPRTIPEQKKRKVSSISGSVPISRLPNTHFAHFGRAEGRAEIYIVFPRMKHKYPLRRSWETKIPYEVETFWLQRLLYPALQNLKERGVSPYTNWEFDDMLFKHQGSREKALLVAPDHLDQIQDTIRKILDENADDETYTRFDSFFFVLQVLGIKLSTSLDNEWGELWDRLVSQHRELDWDYMQDTENGELLVDLGFGFHPPENSNLVGFWDMDAVQQGFDYGGFKSGTAHSICTVSAIGGKNAEMSFTRRKRTHLGYRLIYNLAYEVFRGKETRERENFIPVADAYQDNEAHRSRLTGLKEALQRNKNKSLGVRDEYRCRGTSVRRLLPKLKEKVILPLSSLALEDRSNTYFTGDKIHPRVGPDNLAVQSSLV